MNKRRDDWMYYLLFIGVVCAILLFMLYAKATPARRVDVFQRLETQKPAVTSPFDGCYHVYIDVGAKHGVRVRQLYESHRYPHARMPSLFDTYFGPDRLRGGVCALGIEPSRHYRNILYATQTAFRKCGWPVAFGVETGASDSGKQLPLYSDGPLDEVTTFVESNTNINLQQSRTVSTIWLSQFILKYVYTRHIPARDYPTKPAVVLTLDTEGQEAELLLDLLWSGGFKALNETVVFWHGSISSEPRAVLLTKLESVFETLRKISPKFNVTDVVDEHDVEDLEFEDCDASLHRDVSWFVNVTLFF